MPVRILADECVNRDTSNRLREAGFDVLSVGDLGMIGSSDDDVMAKAIELKRTLLSYDRGFGDIFRFNISKTWGVLIVLINGLDKGEMISLPYNFLIATRENKNSLKGALIIIGKNKIRLIK